MLRVRFHGRGGHGVKTASRILGTAAFSSGLQAQDSPIYGAERRGAAMAAFTRIDSRPIWERGVIAAPDIIVVADETLLADPAAGVLIGSEFASAMFVNSARPSRAIEDECGASCPAIARDLTALTLECIGRGSALSAALGAAACALAGLTPLELVLGAVRQELEELRLAHELIDKNLEAARRAYSQTPKVNVRERPSANVATELHIPEHTPDRRGTPLIEAPGNSPRRHTGAWRVFRPVIDRDACTRCGICFALCPDGAISLDAGAWPVIDYDNCKGCMMCFRECPVHCIHEQKEVAAW